MVQKSNTTQTPPPEVLADLIALARLEAVLLVKTNSDERSGVPGCWFGGEPTLPKRFDWPWIVDEATPRNPIGFLARVDLAQVPRTPLMPPLPATGTLFFLSDHVTHIEKPDAAPNYAVIYAEEDVSTFSPCAQPDWPDDFEAVEKTYWWAENHARSFHKWPMTFLVYED